MNNRQFIKNSGMIRMINHYVKKAPETLAVFAGYHPENRVGYPKDVVGFVRYAVKNHMDSIKQSQGK